MAVLAAPTIDWFGGTEPQAQGVIVDELVPSDEVVITRPVLAAPAFNLIANPSTGHAI
jgi:hypothetical protein